MPALEQRHWDLIGLALVAVSVFLAFLIYLGWDGGRAGDGLVSGLRDLVGAVHYLIPAGLLATGAVLVLRPVLPAVRPFRAAAACLLIAGCLGLAAGTLGIGPEGGVAADKGGLVGEGLYDLSSKLLGEVGSHIVAVFLFVAGALLLTGASVAGVLKATGDSVTHAGRRVRQGAEPVRTAVARRHSPREELAELEAAQETAITKSGRREFWSGADRFPDLYEGEEARIEFRRDAAPAADPEPETEAFEPVEEDPAPPAADAAEPRLAEDPDTDEPGVMRGAVESKPEDLTPQGRLRRSVTDAPDFVWSVPDPRFLTRSTADANRPDTVGQEKVAAQLVEALGHFGVEARVIGMVAGPHITRYELRLAPGIKVGKVAQLKDDLAYALAASDIRILAPIPGKQAVGVEVPNARRRIVHLGDVMQAAPEGWSPLTVWLGKDVAGRSIGADLAKMPHLLVAGTTGAGKSGCVNAMLASILLRATPHEVRLVLVDPKQVELNHYDSIPHLLTPVITSPKQAAVALQNLVREMEQRYSYMALARTRNLIEMNKVRERRGEVALPYILCVIDELADLMMVAPADVEDSIIRLAQKARAVGIHLVLATQSPRVDVITGMIKANVPEPDRVLGLVPDGLARDPRPERGRVAARPGRHAVRAGRLLAPAADPGRLRRRGPDRAADRSVAQAGRARVPRGAARGGRGGGDRDRPRGRLRPRRGPAAERGDPARRRDADGLHVDAPAAAPAGLHACGTAHRHARAPRRDLGLRGLQAAAGAHLRGRCPARPGGDGGARRRGPRAGRRGQ